MKGKSGRFRGNLSGKRVDYSARTVISPDPNLRVDQVGVPLYVAKTMTYPERVNQYNIRKLQDCVRRGHEVHPGANLVLTMHGKGKDSKEQKYNYSLSFLDAKKRNRIANNLKIGDVVERHMEDDDIVLFNRQPSLHKLSIMAHRVKVMRWRTFRFNICVCAPYNADFDGDEMNMHLPQTEEARTEAALLMNVNNNLITPRNGEPLVAASQDFLSASYLFTQKNAFFDREHFCQLVSYLGDAMEHIDLPPPAIFKPVQLWTGKQIFSLMVKPNAATRVLVNFEMKEKMYDQKKDAKSLCKNDGYICFRKSELLSGAVAKSTVGTGSKQGLLYVLLRDYGSAESARVMNRLAKFCSRYFGGHKGFSIGISDVTPDGHLNEIKEKVVSEGYAQCDRHIQDYNNDTLDLEPGCNKIQSLEQKLKGGLSKLREALGEKAMETLPWSNTPRIMADCKSKGSSLNISQMVVCVGQQEVGGKRIQNGFVNRTLPHFEPNELTPQAKGFVSNSFYSGLTATEFFFHTMGGREGLVDTAVKTAETGYMARRMMKALEDLSLRYDSTVRNSEKTVIQFAYGDDGLNPECMENNNRPVDFDRLRRNICLSNPSPGEPCLEKDKLMEMVERHLSSAPWQKLVPVWFGDLKKHPFKDTDGNDVFEEYKILAEVREFFSNCGDRLSTSGSAKESPNVFERRLTKTQFELIVAEALRKYSRSCVEPGEAVGATGAHSITEPGTQMTLKTFHFAGVSSMNVTLGVPRLKEIINASKQISTPIITAALEEGGNLSRAKLTKARVEKTTLGQVCEYIKEVYDTETRCYISIKLDRKVLTANKLGHINNVSVRDNILKGVKGVPRPVILRSLIDSKVQLCKENDCKLRVYVPDDKKWSRNKDNENVHTQVYSFMQQLKSELPEVIISGYRDVARAVINDTKTTAGDADDDDKVSFISYDVCHFLYILRGD